MDALKRHPIVVGCLFLLFRQQRLEATCLFLVLFFQPNGYKFQDNPDKNRHKNFCDNLVYLLKNFGVEKVSILAGGLAGWKRDELPLQQGDVTLPEGEFDATFDANVVKRLTDVLVVSHEKTAQIVDARPAPRFNAEADEPRPGLKRGHIPGALNVPWGDLVFEGELKTTDELRAIFERQGVDLHRPVIASCGSGVTACVVILALATLGANDATLYDGAWSEWGARDDLPVEPAK